MSTSGIDLKALLEEIKANKRLLDSCAGPHELEPFRWYGSNPDKPEGLVRYYRCKLCGGQIPATDARWYLKGVAHGKKSIEPKQA